MHYMNTTVFESIIISINNTFMCFSPGRIGLGGQLVRKMKKASTNLIGGGGNNNRNSLQGGGGMPGGSQGGTLSQRGSRRSTVPNSTSAGANLGSLDGPASGGLNHHGKFCLIPVLGKGTRCQLLYL